jgi:hypothetical protein
MKITRLAGLAAFVTASLLLAESSRAAVLPLPDSVSNLLGNSAVVGDKTFNFVSYTPTGTNPVPASSITVNPLTGPPVGIEFAAPFAAIPNTMNSNDSLIQYTVTSSGTPITAVNLFSNGNTSGAGFAEVVESVFTNVGGQKGMFLGQVSVIGSGTATLNLGSGYGSLYIVKDIQYDVLGTTGTASISAIDQTFTQAIPEPASVVMMGLGLVGAIGVVRLRRKPVVA